MIARRVLGLLVLLALAPATADAGEDSPWPDTEALRPNLRAVQREVRAVDEKIDFMQASVDRYEDWERCISLVPVSEYGDPDRRFGFRYDERDGTMPGYRPALAVDRRSRPGREDYMFLDFARESACESAAPTAGGTADAASVRAGASASPRARAAGPRRLPMRRQIARLERKVLRMKQLALELEQASERFDTWESCVSWVPVTELGDPDGRFGYAFAGGGLGFPFRTALTIDRSDWDDPDYMFLAFVGGDRPGGHCQDEPGEAVD